MKCKLAWLALCGVLLINITGCGSDNTKTISCVIEQTNDYYTMKETNDIVYQKDKTLDTVTTTVYMELSKDYYDDEKFETVISTYEKLQDEINNGTDEAYKGVSVNLIYDKEKYNYSMALTYDVKNMDSDTLSDTEFNDYIDSEFKFDVDKFMEDMNSEDSEAVCTQK